VNATTPDTARATVLAAAAAGVSTVERTLRGGEMTPLHVHAGDEAYYVVDGELTLHVGPDTLCLRAGDSYVAPAGVPHAHRAESARVRVRTATVVASAGRYEDFARAVAVPSGTQPAGEEEAALAVVAAANGIVVLDMPGATAAGEARAA
jgi:quercetin dioxygenase-like cupin family protein